MFFCSDCLHVLSISMSLKVFSFHLYSSLSFPFFLDGRLSERERSSCQIVHSKLCEIPERPQHNALVQRHTHAITHIHTHTQTHTHTHAHIHTGYSYLQGADSSHLSAWLVIIVNSKPKHPQSACILS